MPVCDGKANRKQHWIYGCWPSVRSCQQPSQLRGQCVVSLFRHDVYNDSRKDEEGRLRGISDCMNELFESMGADTAKLSRIADNNLLYKRAIRSIWKDDEAASMILGHTNAFYLREDDRARKGIPLGTSYPVCEVCVDDPLVRSEIDTHKELLAFILRTEGLKFEDMRIISARGDMRKRHPFGENQR